MMRRRAPSEAGLTLIEVLLAVSLLSLLSVGMLAAIRMGFDALHRTDAHLMENRRVAVTQRLLDQEIAGLMPVQTLCAPDTETPPTPFSFFQGQPQTMRLVSIYSLQEAWRGRPRILEFQVIAGDQGRGVRLIVNEIPYTTPLSAGLSCTGMAADPVTGMQVPQFRPIQVGPQSFVLADKLAYCRFAYLEQAQPPPVEPRWLTNWSQKGWPAGVRVEMAPLEDNRARLRPMTITTALPINRNPDKDYVDR
ncbi:MAG TPA: hypothetical protein VKR61_18165 [Bryobacteraceae bacterium]|nr:hypothetical protein [Bryobacteraceae bacterium]